MNPLEVFWEMLPGALPVFYVVLLANFKVINLDIDFALKDATIISLLILVVSRVCNEGKFFFEYHNHGSNDIVGESLRKLYKWVRRAFGQSGAPPKTAARPRVGSVASSAAPSEKHEELRVLQQQMHELYVTTKTEGSSRGKKLLQIDSALERLPWIGPDERYTHYFFLENQDIQAAYRSYTTGYNIVARTVPALLLIALVSASVAIFHAQRSYFATIGVAGSDTYSVAMLVAGLLALGGAWWMGTWAETIRYNRNLMQARLLFLLLLRDNALGRSAQED